MVLTVHNRGGRSCQQSGRSIYRFKCLIILHDHDRVLVLTAHNRGGRSCQQSGRSIYRLECLIIMHDYDLVLVLTAHNQGGRSCQQSGRSIYRSKCLILIHDHDLVLVLTAHNQGGQSCLRPGHYKFTVGHLCHFFYEIFIFLYIYLRCLLGVVGEFCGTWLLFCALQRTSFYPYGTKDWKGQ